MALKIRLARGGAKKRPFYRIVVAEASAPRDGRYVEKVGHYNPMVAKDNEQRLVVNGERVSYWLGQGAQATERVQKLLSEVEMMAKVEMRDQPKKSAPGKSVQKKKLLKLKLRQKPPKPLLLKKLPQQKLLLPKPLLLKKHLLKKPLLLLKKHLLKKHRLKKQLQRKHLLKTRKQEGLTSWLSGSLKWGQSPQPMA